MPGEFHAQRSLAGYSPWGHRESDTTEQLNYNTVSTREVSVVNTRVSLFSIAAGMKTKPDTLKMVRLRDDIKKLGFVMMTLSHGFNKFYACPILGYI